MENIKINIITRFSREESIKNCLKSLYSQNYNNYHHWITYESDDDLNLLKSLVNEEKTTLIKVQKYKQFKNLWMYYQYHDVYTDYLNKDWVEKSKTKITIGEKPNKVLIDSSENEKIEKVFKYEKDNFWCMTLPTTLTNVCQHFPFNVYLKIAESHIKDGWIFYIDDDDVFEDEYSLSYLVFNIISTDEDTLQIGRVRTRGNNGQELIPHDSPLKFMKTGHPIIHMEVITGCFAFHSKYKDYTVWDEWRMGDVRTAKALESVIPKISFFDKILVKAHYREKIYQ